ncbi:MAG: hypothetical protein U0R68_17735 [Candidatus Nanopelagicales bacterium]
MTALLFVVVFLLIAVASPFFGADRSDARSEEARPAQGWFPGARRRHA